MQHCDARAVRERLNSIVVAIVTLEENPDIPQRMDIARTAFQALHEIASMITVDEEEENGQPVRFDLLKIREEIRRKEPCEEYYAPSLARGPRTGNGGPHPPPARSRKPE